MGIDFHNQQHRTSYTTRQADSSWKAALAKHIPFHSMGRAVDIGCGGGIYAKALVDMGVASVTGVDFSLAMLDGAKLSSISANHICARKCFQYRACRGYF